ncbi:helix-turn-helix domain-containing protein [Asticcacaulis tiandongensis]|uniref:helix-turn-helix domain-containing protein n=1 Tax=Asticcacaulis tiandongensis TaxID=2565365 RepID=UPI001125F622
MLLKVRLTTHDWVKECLRRRGTNFSSIARQAGVSTSLVYSVSKGITRSARIENMLSSAIGFSPEQIWLDRGAADHVSNEPPSA